jgi:hypothetical protein
VAREEFLPDDSAAPLTRAPPTRRRRRVEAVTRLGGSYFVTLTFCIWLRVSAQNLLMDLTDLADQYHHREKGEYVVPEDVCVDCDGDPGGTSAKPVSTFTGR